MSLVLAYAPRSHRSLVQLAGGVIILVALIGLALIRTAQLLAG